MNQLLQDAAVPALCRLDLPFALTDDLDAISVRVPTSVAGEANLRICADGAAAEVTLSAGICRVPSAKRHAVGLLVSEYNARYKFPSFSMTMSGDVSVDICMDLDLVVARDVLLERSLGRLLHAISETYDEVMATAGAKPSSAVATAELTPRGMLQLAS
jgi:hypothetical protein